MLRANSQGETRRFSAGSTRSPSARPGSRGVVASTAARQVALATVAGVLALAATAVAAPPMPAEGTASVRAGADSGLAFRPLAGPGDRFSVSNLTRSYERDLTLWSSRASGSARDLAWLDRHGRAMAGSASAGADSSDIDVVGATPVRDPTAMTPADKDAAQPPQPPVRVGVPSPVAVAGSLLGGLALLVQLIAKLAK